MLCWKPSRKFFFEFAKVTFFFSRKFRESWISWLTNIGSAKDKHGVRESFTKVTCLFAKNGRSRINEIWSTTICNYYSSIILLYIYIYLDVSTICSWNPLYHHSSIILLDVSLLDILSPFRIWISDEFPPRNQLCFMFTSYFPCSSNLFRRCLSLGVRT